MKELGSGAYQPSVFAFFPRMGRGHSAKNCVACRTGGMKKHQDQAGNRKEWEESVGIHRTSKATRTAMQQAGAAVLARLDPKEWDKLPTQ